MKGSHRQREPKSACFTPSTLSTLASPVSIRIQKELSPLKLRRDVSQHLDDYFEIVIDSAHDRRNAYVFQINPLGTQRDALITEEQQGGSDDDGDPGWDGVWTSEARITEQGWTATVAHSVFDAQLHEVE